MAKREAREGNRCKGVLLGEVAEEQGWDDLSPWRG
jgi:hypothetical protein